MMLITLPVFMPIVQRLEIDLIWFGVLYLICMQLGLLLPPHGLLLMTMKGVAPPEVTMAHIFRAVVPYITMSLLLLLIIISFPAIATWLPNILACPAIGCPTFADICRAPVRRRFHCHRRERPAEKCSSPAR